MINVKEYSETGQRFANDWGSIILYPERTEKHRFSSKHMRHGEMKWQTICMGCLPLPCGMMRNRNYSV